MKPIKLSRVAVLAVLLCVACSGGRQPATGPPASSPRPASPAKLTILSPSNGEVIHSSTVHLRARLIAAKAGGAAATQTGPGFIHVYLDSKIVSIEIASANEVTEQTIHGLTPGQHQLRVEFVGPTHLPFHPRVIATVTFVAKP